MTTRRRATTAILAAAVGALLAGLAGIAPPPQQTGASFTDTDFVYANVSVGSWQPRMYLTYDLTQCSSSRVFVPISLNGTATGTIDWGDGAVTDIYESSHTYASPGVYQVKVHGTFTHMGTVGAKESAECLVSVDEWYGTGTTSAAYAFRYASNLTKVAPLPPTVQILDNAFREASVTVDLSGWDVSNVKFMSYMFSGATVDTDLSGWDTSSVEKMDDMFNGATVNTDISKWDTSSVRNMNNMFRSSTFNGDISGWNVSSVTSMNRMFYGAKTFDQDLSGWDVSHNPSHSYFDNNAAVWRAEYKPRWP